jgi:hypothetical protein
LHQLCQSGSCCGPIFLPYGGSDFHRRTAHIGTDGSSLYFARLVLHVFTALQSGLSDRGLCLTRSRVGKAIGIGPIFG